MVCIRPATLDDLLAMQRCNLLCLPENYQLKVRHGVQLFPPENLTVSKVCSKKYQGVQVLLLNLSVKPKVVRKRYQLVLGS
jgi:hypothetical protein